MSDPPLILTLRFDTATFARLDGMREAHFPPGRNLVPAHATLFHAVPAGEAEAQTLLDEVAADFSPVAVHFPRVRFLGKGVALNVESPGLMRVRARLAAEWAAGLTPQDRQPYRPHVTVQNKADPAAARFLFENLAAGWQPLAGVGDALLLWRYLAGPWELASEHEFGGAG